MKNRIGIVGGGQLSRMLIFDAKKMGFYVTVLDPTPNSPGGQVADKQIVATLSDKKAMEELAKNSDYLTIEWELADDKLLENFAKRGIPVNPSAQALRIIKDKFVQKKFLKSNKIPVADFEEVKTNPLTPALRKSKQGQTSSRQIESFARRFGYPFLLKAKMDAYDGRGNYLVKKRSDIQKAFDKLKGRNLYVEKYIPFEKEISVIVARSTKAEVVTFPVGENIHKNNILHMTIVPARIPEKTYKKAILLAKKTIELLKGAGVFGIEMFVTKNGKVLVNEIAPRVHNSGHYSIEACVTSQFEQHVRAITGLPLGQTSLKTKSAVMVNILGERKEKTEVKGLENALKILGVTVHIYGKSETRIDRKMGHITAIGDNWQQTLKNATKARKYITI